MIEEFEQPSLMQYVYFILFAFLTVQYLDDPTFFRNRVVYLFEVFCTILHAPLDILIDIFQDQFNHRENLRKYKLNKKKHLFWDKVNDETKKSWRVSAARKKSNIDLEKSLKQTTQAATQFLLNLQKGNQNNTPSMMIESEDDVQKLVSFSRDDIDLISISKSKSQLDIDGNSEIEWDELSNVLGLTNNDVPDKFIVEETPVFCDQ